MLGTQPPLLAQTRAPINSEREWHQIVDVEITAVRIWQVPSLRQSDWKRRNCV